MKKNNEIVPIETEILVWARTRINMSISEVAQKIKKDTETIDNWEQGIELPTLAQLEKLAYDVYKLPLAVFFLPEPPAEQKISKQFRTIPEQEVSLLPSYLMIKVREGQYLQESLKELYNNRNPVINPIFKKFSLNPNVNLKELASELRKELRIDKNVQSTLKNTTDAFKYYRNQLEKLGIFVFQQTLKDYCRGYSLYDDEFPIIIINSSEISDTGKNFTIFHELSHLLLNSGGITSEYTYGSDNYEEILCNKLASNILVDDNELLNNDLVSSNTSFKWSDYLLQDLSKLHKVSKEVILRKLLDLNLTTQSFYLEKRDEWLAQLPKKRKGSGGNYYLNKISQLGNNYTSVILGNLYNGRINTYQASEYLGVKINQLPEIEKIVFK